jgi:hypothetical protein
MGDRIRLVPEVAGRPDAWYSQAIRQSRTRYGRDQGGTG